MTGPSSINPSGTKRPDRQSRAPDNLQRCHYIKIMTDEQRPGEIAGWATRWRRHVKELKENVQSEKDEHGTQYDPGNCSSDFHKIGICFSFCCS